MAKTITLYGHNYRVMTKEHARSVYRDYVNSFIYDLHDSYGTYSIAKENAFKYCKARQNEFNSYDGAIVSYNNFMFTFAFTGMFEGKRYFIYITKENDYAIPCEDF